MKFNRKTIVPAALVSCVLMASAVPALASPNHARGQERACEVQARNGDRIARYYDMGMSDRRIRRELGNRLSDPSVAHFVNTETGRRMIRNWGSDRSRFIRQCLAYGPGNGHKYGKHKNRPERPYSEKKHRRHIETRGKKHYGHVRH